MAVLRVLPTRDEPEEEVHAIFEGLNSIGCDPACDVVLRGYGVVRLTETRRKNGKRAWGKAMSYGYRLRLRLKFVNCNWENKNLVF